MRRLTAILTLLALLCGLAGCFSQPEPVAPMTLPTDPTTEPTTEPTKPELTAELLMSLVSEAINGRSISRMDATLTVDLGIKMDMQGFSMSMNLLSSTEMDMIIQEYPSIMYADMAVQVEMMGQAQIQKADAYYLIEDGKMVCYVYDRSLKSWTFAELGEVQGSDVPEEDPEMPSVEFTLDEETQKVLLREAYVLRGELPREYLSKMITPMTGNMIMPLSTDPADLPEELRAETVIYVDTKTLLPIRIQMDIWGIEGILNDLLQGSTNTPMVNLSMSAIQTEESPYEISINTFRIELDSVSFEPVEVPQVPQEAYDYVRMSTHDPDLGDGSYLLVHTGTAANITPPEDWVIWDMGFYWLYVDHPTEPIYASYTMLSGMTRQQMNQYVLRDSVTPMQEAGILDSYSYGDRIGKFETMSVNTAYGTTFLYTWAPMSDGWIMITVEDETGGDMYEILTPLIEAVESHDPLY